MRKKYAGKRQILDFDDLIARLGEYALVCVPTTALMAARAFLETRGQWTSSYAKEWGENYYQSPTQEELKPILEAYAEFTEVTHNMNCNDFLLGLQDIADAVRESGCCSTINGSAGSGPVEAEEETFEDTGANYPPEFDDRAEYDTWKCGVAQLIIDLWRTDIEYLQDTDFLAVAASFVAASLLTPIPGDEVIALVGLGIALVVEGTLVAVTNAIATAIDNNEDELRCIFYNAIDAATLKGELESWFDGKLSAVQSTFVGYLVNYDVLNWVFSKVNQILPAADCSSCVCGWEVIWGSGVIETNGSQFTITAETNINGHYHVEIIKTSGCCPDNGMVSLVSWTGSPDGGFGVEEWATPCPASNRIVTRATPITGVWTARSVSILDTSDPFTATFTIVD